jgi:hypothetical protein
MSFLKRHNSISEIRVYLPAIASRSGEAGGSVSPLKYRLFIPALSYHNRLGNIILKNLMPLRLCERIIYPGAVVNIPKNKPIPPG